MISINYKLNTIYGNNIWSNIYSLFKIGNDYNIVVLNNWKNNNELNNISNGIELSKFLSTNIDQDDYCILIKLSNIDDVNLDFILKTYGIALNLKLEIYMKITFVNNKIHILEKIEKIDNEINLIFSNPLINNQSKTYNNNLINSVYNSYQNLLVNMNYITSDILDINNNKSISDLNNKLVNHNFDLEYNLIKNNFTSILAELDIFKNDNNPYVIEKIQISDITNYYNKLNKLFYLYIKSRL